MEKSTGIERVKSHSKSSEAATTMDAEVSKEMSLDNDEELNFDTWTGGFPSELQGRESESPLHKSKENERASIKSPTKYLDSSDYDSDVGIPQETFNSNLQETCKCEASNEANRKSTPVTSFDSDHSDSEQNIRKETASVSKVAASSTKTKLSDKKSPSNARPEPKEKWIMHYNSSHKILLVGEGDFSFALCLAKAFGSAKNMVATSFEPKGKLLLKYSKVEKNLEKLEQLGCKILHKVNAHSMSEHHFLSTERFDRVIFNFPHAGFYRTEDSDEQIQLHKELMKGFFASARCMLTDIGEIHVTHKAAHPYSTWGIKKLAQQAQLVNMKEHKFSRSDYPGYSNKRGDGTRSDESFSVGECYTFTFSKNSANELQEAIASVIFAALRCADIPELVDILKHFTAKYGIEIDSAAVELRPEFGGSPTNGPDSFEAAARMHPQETHKQDRRHDDNGKLSNCCNSRPSTQSSPSTVAPMPPHTESSSPSTIKLEGNFDKDRHEDTSSEQTNENDRDEDLKKLIERFNQTQTELIKNEFSDETNVDLSGKDRMEYKEANIRKQLSNVFSDSHSSSFSDDGNVVWSINEKKVVNQSASDPFMSYGGDNKRDTKETISKEKWIMHYSSSHKILLVGEGDFSFALCLAKAFGSAKNMVATSLERKGKLLLKFSEVEKNLEKLRELGCKILHEVNAHNMNKHRFLCTERFDRIIFNFPRGGLCHKESSDEQIERHNELVKGFFASARCLLTDFGEIHVTLKAAHPFSTRGIKKLAKKALLVNMKKHKFSISDYPGYRNKKGDGNRSDESFSVGECYTFTFSCSFS